MSHDEPGPATPDAAEETASGPAPLAAPGARAKILIVDDDERNAFAALHALEELGHELVVARSGEEALRRLLDEEYAVILLDLHMPGMDGYETAALIRSRKRTRATPIVFLTAVFRDEHHTLQAYSAGAVDIVFKPVDPFILRSKVSVLVNLHLMTMEARRDADHRQRLLEENARVRLEKLRAERQLAQAQKMEAVGQLTGGVAHDFNNLLTVVLGNVDLLSRKLDKDPKTERQLGAIRHAADRGRSLTRQLLAFSRRQHLSPVTLNVNVLVQNFVPLLQQAVGESVSLEAEVPDEQLCVHADPAQLETALLNLAVNARDAMPEGGELVIRARRVTAEDAPQQMPENRGDWVCLDVSDNGSGIEPEVLERVFEPFFTTKEVGKGSGLGLSQVYGFVRQSGGFVTAESKLGAGTRFLLYLPASLETPAERPVTAEPQAAARGRSERILVVEDDEPVLALTVEMLGGLGYRITTARDAPSALQVLKGDEPFDLLFSDVVMPGGISGVQLAHMARELRPGLKVLLTSGYVGEAGQGEEFDLMDKPYERTALANKLRELLDAPAAPEPAPVKRRKQKASVAS